jgi:hypothetical protein
MSQTLRLTGQLLPPPANLISSVEGGDPPPSTLQLELERHRFRWTIEENMSDRLQGDHGYRQDYEFNQ